MESFFKITDAKFSANNFAKAQVILYMVCFF